jgi:hypothetical protein
MFLLVKRQPYHMNKVPVFRNRQLRLPINANSVHLGTAEFKFSMPYSAVRQGSARIRQPKIGKIPWSRKRQVHGLLCWYHMYTTCGEKKKKKKKKKKKEIYGTSKRFVS